MTKPRTPPNPARAPEPWVPPGVLGAIAKATDHETAEIIAKEFSGRRVRIPEKASAPDQLVGLVGMEAAQRIIAAIPPGKYDIPAVRLIGAPTLKQRILNEVGSTAEIARRLGCTSRYVRAIRRGKRS